MIGFEGAGKTLILYKLKLDEVITAIPTMGFNRETIEQDDINMTIWDVGGGPKIQPIWRDFYENTDAIVWVLDANARGALEKNKEYINSALSNSQVHGAKSNVLLLVMANKQDL